MTRAEAEAHARAWVRDWCARDIDRIVSHYAEEVRFVSPVAAQRTGHAVVTGREALRRYWAGTRVYRSFAFALERVLWDGEQQELVVIYTREIEGKRSRACEMFRFDAGGQVVAGEAMYGAEDP